MDITQELDRIVDRLRAAKLEYALCGGIAVVIHGHPRLTRDIDVLIRAEDLDAVRAELAQIGYVLSSGILPFDVGRPTERRVFRVSKVDGDDLMTVDLRLTGPFLDDVWQSREHHRSGDRELVVVSRDGLAKMKRAAGRRQDLADLDALGLGESDP